MAKPGIRMRNRRVQLDMSLTEAADQMGISPQYLSSLELGKNEPPVWTLLAKMAVAYTCTADFLLGVSPNADGAVLGEPAKELQALVAHLGHHRQQEILTIAQALHKLDQQALLAQREPQQTEATKKLADLYAMLETAGRLDLLTDVAAALLGDEDQSKIDHKLGLIDGNAGSNK